MEARKGRRADRALRPAMRSPGIVVEVPARIDRAAASASRTSDLPLLRRERRSPRFTSTTRCPPRRR